ncbi:hypothetical protein [Vibrio sp. Vb339]|uniref:hypothetical protein n=1 Tax=Vibrio sp. Vb339 TaxID=1192013 RepID=UPI001553663F|nr:hypothetical protein [Vibrio sp. Vb339]
MYRKQIVATALSIFALAYSLPTSAATYLECYKCTQKQVEQKVLTWAFKNISENEAIRNITKDIHVVNLYNVEIQSFKARKKAILGPPPPNPYIPRKRVFVADFKRISSPSNISSKLENIKRERSQLKAQAQELVIPLSIIRDPWEFVKCAYCENAVQSYFNNSLSGQIATLGASITKVAQTLNLISTAIPDQYLIRFESGGYAIFGLTVVVGEPTRLLFKVKKVVDIDNNTIPMTSKELPGLNIRIADPARGAVINNYIQRFNYAVPTNVTGVVTITVVDCVNNASNCS